jgi:hypothetical protein
VIVDLQGNRWKRELVRAGYIANTPAGTVAATTVQGAINELDLEKVSYAALAASSGSSLVGYTQGGTGAVAATVQSKLREVVSVFDFMTATQIASVRARNGVEDVTSAIQNAVNYYSTGNGTVFFPGGLYKVTSTITVAQSRVHLVGQGIFATQINFAPTANGSCFSFTAGAASLYQCSLKGMNFYSSDNTYVKTAISLNDIREFALVDVEIGGGVIAVPGSYFWSNATGASRGLYTTGREALSVQRFKAYADKPIVMGVNPNFATIHTDLFHFQDCFLAAANNPCVTVLDGVNMTNLTFDGYQTWNLGTHGFYWNDVTSSTVSYNVTLRGVRTEQGLDTTAYSVYLSGYGTQNFTLAESRLDLYRNGIYLRKAISPKITSITYTGGAGTTCLDVDATVDGLTLQNCLWVINSTANLVGQYLVWSDKPEASASPLPYNAVYTSDANLRRMQSDSAWFGTKIVVNNGATADIGTTTTYGIMNIVTTAKGSAIAEFQGGGAIIPVALVHNSGGDYTTTAGNAGTINIYWDAGTAAFKLQNNTATPLTFVYSLTGSFTAI